MAIFEKIIEMKHLLVFILALLSKTLFSQDSLLSVAGTVADSKGGNLPNLTIVLRKLSDSSITKSGLTNTEGHFLLKNLKPERYLVEVSAVGYETFHSEPFELLQPLTLGVIKLATKPGLMSAVVVRAQKPLMEQKVDRLVMNVENSILAAGNNTLELLEQVPYVSVDQNGGITLRGTQNVTVFLDGKVTYLSASDLANFLKTLQASQIASIEIITNPSSKYEAAGNGGIINIKLKKNLTSGLNGSFNTDFQQGRLPRFTNGLTLNYRKGRTNLYGGLTRADAKRWVEETTDLLFYDNNTKQRQSSFSVFENTKYHSGSSNMRVGLDYAYNNRTTLGVLVNIFGGHENEDALNKNTVHSFALSVDSMLQTKHSGVSNWNRYTGNINLRHQFDSNGRVLSFDFDYADFKDRSRPDYLTDYYSASGSKVATVYLNGDMGTHIKLASFKGDYEHPLSATANFAAGFKWSRVETQNSIKYFQNGVFDRNRSNDFDYLETINAAYVDIDQKLDRVSLKAGLRVEHTISIGTQITQKSKFQKNYLQFFPTFFIRYKWNEAHSSGITMNRRIGRPDYESLNPFIYLSDPYTSWGGNPNLNPAMTQTFDINHSYKGMLNVFVSYNQTKGTLSRIQLKDSLSSGAFSTWENLGKSTMLSAGVSTFLKLTKWWRMNNNIFVFKNASSGQLGDLTANASVVSYRVFTNSNFIISKKFSAEMSAFYRPASLWAVSKTGPLGSISIGVQAKILKDNGSIKISGGDILRTMRMNTVSAYTGLDSRYHSMSETQVVRLAFTYRFGRKQVKDQRERMTASEDESNRIKSRN